MPTDQTQDIKKNITHHHCQHLILSQNQQDTQLGDAHRDRSVQINVRTVMADQQQVIQQQQKGESAPNTKQL